MSLPRAAALAVLGCLFAASPAAAADRYQLVQIGKFDRPTYVTTPPSGRDRVFVVARGGRVRIIRRGKTLKRPFLDIHDQVLSTGQRGLLSLGVAPDYARSGRFYVFYVTRKDTVQIDEYRRSPSNPDRAAWSTRRRVLNVGAGGIYHHGGQLQFGPDGELWISTGVGGHRELAQNL